MSPNDVINEIRAMIADPPIIKKEYFTIRNKKAIMTSKDTQTVGKKMKIIDPEAWKLDKDSE